MSSTISTLNKKTEKYTDEIFVKPWRCLLLHMNPKFWIITEKRKQTLNLQKHILRSVAGYGSKDQKRITKSREELKVFILNNSIPLLEDRRIP
jgi:hypothetical protein